MPPQRIPFLLVLCCIGLAPRAEAQQAPRYAPQAEPVVIESTNPHFMYFVAGGDTLGEPVDAVTLERWTWTPADSLLQVIVELESLLPDRSVKEDTFHVDGRGRVRTVNGRAPGLHTRVDLLPRLPTEPLAIGARWSDTLRAHRKGPAGEHLYVVAREYVVERSIDMLGAAVLEIAARGDVRYRDAWWTDESETASTWIDVRGPVREVIGFDAAAGRLLYRRWEMDLRGEGGLNEPGGRVVRVPAGLRSASTQRVVDATRAAALRADPRGALPEP